MTTYTPVSLATPPAPMPLKPHTPAVKHKEPVSVAPDQDGGRMPNPEQLITYVFPDFNAANYFQKDFISSNEFFIMEESQVSGFDLYVVEQWVNSRKIGTVVATYTGDMSSKVSVVKFTIIKKQSKFYPIRLQEYLNELMTNHAKIKKMDERLPSQRNSGSYYNLTAISSVPPSFPPTDPSSVSSNTGQPEEVCFVTNLASLPSNLNLIPISTGDSRTILDDFIINSNLKKLRCCGRSLYLTTHKISDANEDKFRHMYKVDNDNIPIKFAIRELVNVVQTCLFFFDLLDAKHCDGLLCNKTEEAILNWWNLIGLPHFNVKPNPKNGILPARSVAAIISLTISVKLRLHLVGGCDVPKDPFDFENFMLSIGQFQKQYKLEKKRKLDLETLNKLFSVTNTRLLPEKYKSYIGNSSFDNYDEENQFSGNNLISTPQRRSKNYYSMELKKLTNVVKNTVQDIQAASRDNDDSPNGKSSGRIRNKIAKLADNISPIDVETLDLELFVKHYITGKTLIRLFYGLSDSTPNQKLNATHLRGTNSGDRDYSHNQYSKSLRSHGHQHRHRQYSANSQSRQYKFSSLKEKITSTQKSMITGSSSDLSKYSRGFNKMKIGLSNRKLLGSNGKRNGSDDGNNSTPFSALENSPLNDPDNSHDIMLNSSVLDSSLQIPPETNNGDGKSMVSHSSSNKNAITPLEKLHRRLNRRNSYPNLLPQETNLNLLEFSKKDRGVNQQDVSMPYRFRSASLSKIDFPEIETEQSDPVSIENFSHRYISGVDLLIKYENLLSYYETDDLQPSGSFSKKDNNSELVTTSKVQKKYNTLNLELVKLRNVYQQMHSSKSKVVDEDLMNDLKYNIEDLKGTVDRLVYETRIVVKRINELDESSKVLDVKLNEQCTVKLEDLITNLISSRKFNEVFKNASEREEITKKLMGKNKEGFETPSEESDNNVLKVIITFIYDMILFLFHLFKFDGTNMNLDRIRRSWGKLDPNRKIINRAYSYVGREPSRSSVTSIEMSE